MDCSECHCDRDAGRGASHAAQGPFPVLMRVAARTPVVSEAETEAFRDDGPEVTLIERFRAEACAREWIADWNAHECA